MPLRTALTYALLSAAALAGCSSHAEAPPLPAVSIDAERVAVVGLSSGAYMATQAHIALSDRIHGAALIAGGPYGCAGGDLNVALGPCMTAQPEPPALVPLLNKVRAAAAAGTVPPLQGLAGDRVLVLHGAQDDKVAPAVGAVAAEFYRGLAADAPGLTVEASLDGAYGHLLSTAGEGGNCSASESPFIAACGFDAAAAVFTALYGAAPRAAVEAAGTLRGFDQNAVRGEGPEPNLADTGYLYVPPQCADSSCGLLVAFHGCKQNADAVGAAFVREAGFNRWADAYGVVVLYPQTRASFAPLNPNACWDWWGYTGAEYDTRAGAQIQWLARALTAFGV